MTVPILHLTTKSESIKFKDNPQSTKAEVEVQPFLTQSSTSKSSLRDEDKVTGDPKLSHSEDLFAMYPLVGSGLSPCSIEEGHEEVACVDAQVFEDLRPEESNLEEHHLLSPEVEADNDETQLPSGQHTMSTGKEDEMEDKEVDFESTNPAWTVGMHSHHSNTEEDGYVAPTQAPRGRGLHTVRTGSTVPESIPAVRQVRRLISFLQFTTVLQAIIHRMSSPVSSSDEEFQPRQSEVDHVSESTSTEGQRGTEQRSQGPGGRRQRVSQRDEDRIDNDLLISLVQERVPLWDSRDQQHAVNSVLRRLWSEVAQALWDGWENSPPRVRNAFVEKVRTRWRSMKDRFNKDLRAEKSAASGSGARHRLYKYHRVLAFLRPVLLMRTTHCTTVATGSGAVLQPAATDPSQPSSSAAPGGSSTLTGDQGAGPSGLPLSQSSFAAPIFAGSSRQRQRASDRSLMPEFLHLSSVLHEAIKALGDRMDVTHNLLNCRIQDVAKSVDQLKADLKKPAHHFFNQILEGMSEHLSPDLQLSVMQACNVAFVQAMQQSQSRNVAAYPTVPSLSQVNTIPTSAAYHCTATSIPSTGVLHYSANTMTSAVGHPTATTVTTAAPAWTSSADTTMTQDPGVAYRPGTLPMQQDPSMQYRTGPPQMQQDPGLAFRTGPTPMQQDRGLAYLTGPTPMQQDRGVAFRAGHPPMQQDQTMDPP
ncbi:uncharacterized protein LOC143817632 [Ranitomeya variabilis]|uniref:uncharacterized protein LOC143817632 n=1 Tax=Ranitomeya variabilis TaxID=490064 RepID=UPI004055F2FC